MSQKLFRFIDSLTPDELGRVSGIRAVGKQELVLRFAIDRYRQSRGKASEENFLPQISREHLYEICSIMLERVYTMLVPAGGLATLEFLVSKDLQVLFREECRKQVKLLVPTLTPEQTQEYYYSVVCLLLRFDSRLIEEDFFLSCRQSYIALHKRNRTATLLMDIIDVEIKLKLAETKTIGVSVVKPNMHELLPRLNASLERDGDELCRFHMARMRAALERSSSGDVALIEQWEKVALEIAPRLQSSIHRETPLLITFRLADLFVMRGDYGRAYERYVSLFEKIPIDNRIRTDVTVNLRFAEYAITVGEFEQAHTILDERLSHLFYVLPSHRGVHAAILFGLLSVFEGDLDLAAYYCELAQTLNSRRNYTFPLDLQSRYLECAIAALRNDATALKEVVSRGIQLLRMREMALKSDVEGHYFLIIEAFLQCAASGERLKSKRTKYYNYFTTPKFGVLGKLLEHLRMKMNVPMDEIR